MKVNTIMVAIGRDPIPGPTSQLGLEVDKDSRKLLGRVNEPERTTKWDHIYAVGDIIHNVPELQTVA